MKQRQDLVYFDRYKGELTSEAIYGEKPLRWAYETRLGRLALEGIIKRPWFSRWYGKWADLPASTKEIAPFIDRFALDPSEFLDPVESYRSFNDFFYRRLQAAARPIATGDETISFPADGRHLYLPDLSQAAPIYAKGQRFDLPALLGDHDLAAQFEKGSVLISRLCPIDYHRFHFPLAGTPGDPTLLNGPLYSVNPIALSQSLQYLWQNKRQLTILRESPLGTYLFLEIGATNVGSIVNTAVPHTAVERGDEKGYFRFGGSMVILIFPENRFQPTEDLREQSELGIELYAQFGDAAGRTSSTTSDKRT